MLTGGHAVHVIPKLGRVPEVVEGVVNLWPFDRPTQDIETLVDGLNNGFGVMFKHSAVVGSKTAKD